MQIDSHDPFETCPELASKYFTYRLVRLDDAQDLLSCYADPLSAPLFNADNCTSDFIYHTLEEMQTSLRFWLDAYTNGYFVRISIVARDTDKAIGTLECCTKPQAYESLGYVAILRIDLASAYETKNHLSDILSMVDAHFFALFGVQSMLTKAVPQAQERITALRDAGYTALADNPVQPFPHYYVNTMTHP